MLDNLRSSALTTSTSALTLLIDPSIFVTSCFLFSAMSENWVWASIRSTLIRRRESCRASWLTNSKPFTNSLPLEDDTNWDIWLPRLSKDKIAARKSTSSIFSFKNNATWRRTRSKKETEIYIILKKNFSFDRIQSAIDEGRNCTETHSSNNNIALLASSVLVHTSRLFKMKFFISGNPVTREKWFDRNKNKME